LDKRIQQWKTGRKSVFKCQDCHRSFKRAEFLKRHEIRVHKQDTRLFACSLCIRKFSRSEALEAHLKVHRISKRSANLSEHTQLDEDVEELLLQIIDDFVEDTVKSTSAFAKHRKSNKIEVRDVQLHFERKYNMWIPGFGTDELRPYKRAAVTEAHKQRLALIRKTIKKY